MNEHQSSYHMLINGNEIKQDVVDMEKDLGITFDKRLEFDYHIQEKRKPTLCMVCLEEHSYFRTTV